MTVLFLVQHLPQITFLSIQLCFLPSPPSSTLAYFYLIGVSSILSVLSLLSCYDFVYLVKLAN